MLISPTVAHHNCIYNDVSLLIYDLLYTYIVTMARACEPGTNRSWFGCQPPYNTSDTETNYQLETILSVLFHIHNIFLFFLWLVEKYKHGNFRLVELSCCVESVSSIKSELKIGRHPWSVDFCSTRTCRYLHVLDLDGLIQKDLAGTQSRQLELLRDSGRICWFDEWCLGPNCFFCFGCNNRPWKQLVRKQFDPWARHRIV